MKKTLLPLVKGVIHSYGQIFFTNSILFSLLILLATFVYSNIALSGLLATIFSLTWAKILRLPTSSIENGYYGYNSLLVGLGLGSMFTLTIKLIIVLLISSLFTSLLHIYLDKKWEGQKLYPLSLPFVAVLIITVVAINQAKHFVGYEEKIFVLNHYASLHPTFGNWYEEVQLHLPPFWKYLGTALSSVLFLDDFFIGLFLLFLLLLYSRISFSLALLGFSSAYFVITLLGLEKMFGFFSAGFNFILLAIALGGFFVVPSTLSYIAVFVFTSLNVFLTLFFNYLFSSIFHTSSYALPFIVLTNLFAYLLPSLSQLGFHPVIYQEYKPEFNLHRHRNIKKRFSQVFQYFPLQLPFLGKWMVVQDYEGEYTHKGEYRFALDFMVVEDGKTYENNGSKIEDYFTYGQWVVAPGNGYVVALENNVPDNPIGEVNEINNWGNTIVIQHAVGLYTQHSHLQAGSIQVNVGDYVYRGQILARVGNSGRSPYPHLHFQVQPFPAIGSKPIPYPFVRYKKTVDGQEKLCTYEIPQKNDIVENIYPKLSTAFSFKPGMDFTIKTDDGSYHISVYVDPYNQTYLYCHKTKSVLFVYNDIFRHYFTHFQGTKKSPLYVLYLASFTVELSFLPSLSIEDEIPLHKTINPLRLFFVDFISPFYLPLRTLFYSSYFHDGEQVQIHSHVILINSLSKRSKKIYDFNIRLNKQIETIFETRKNKLYEFVW